ncbi:MAG: ABC transporter ATP-binding protein [Chloroflexi bacterium]|nr:ABC transporter ATP-binding protein [Chloroflexota bacterium]
MRRLFGFLTPHRRFFVALTIVNILLSAMLTIGPLVTKAIVDDVIGAARLDLLVPYLGVFIAVTVVRTTMTYFYSYGQNRLGQLVMTDVRAALYRKMLALQYSFYDKEQTGRLMSRISSDVESTRLFLSQILVESFSHLFTIILASIATLYQDSLLAAIAVGPMLASGFGLYLIHRSLAKPWSLQHERFAKLSSTLQDSLSGIKVVKSFAQEVQEEGKFDASVQAVMAGNIGIQDSWNKRWIFVGSVGRFMQLVLLGVGGYRVMNGDISIGTLVAVLSLSMLLLGAINALGTQLNAFSQTATASVRIFELLDEPVTIRSVREITEPIPPIRGEIEFCAVSFAYATSKVHVLKKIDLHVPAGSSLALVGATGAGKSTLINLIGRYYDPSSGMILIDGIDVKQMDLPQLRRQVGYVSQDNLLFSATVAENISFGRPDATQEQIERAARLAQAHDFIGKMKDGYNTRIGERGVGLSGGQRQRVAIARAILLDPKILILDDSMSALDAETEKLLQAAISTVMQGRTTILIAHRLSTVEKADKIIVLKEGSILEQGTNSQLIQASGYYRQVLELQRMATAEALSETVDVTPRFLPEAN